MNQIKENDMTEEEITSLAREYAEWICPYKDKSANLSILDIREAERLINFLLRRFCLVEKSKATDLCRLTLEHDQSVDYGLIDGLTDIVLEVFPEQYHQVAEKLSNPEIAKEVEG